MDLEEARRLWQQDDARCALRLDAALLERSRLDRAGGALKGLSQVSMLELFLDVVLVIFLGAFIGNHVHEPRFLIPAVVFDAFAIASLGAVARRLAAIATLDFGLPIVDIQQKLERLRVLRIRTVQWTLLVAPLMWAPLLIVALRGLFSVDAYVALGDGYIIANGLFGVVVLAAGVFLSRRYADRFDRFPFVRRVADTLAGRSLSEATRALGTITHFAAPDGAQPGS